MYSRVLMTRSGPSNLDVTMTGSEALRIRAHHRAELIAGQGNRSQLGARREERHPTGPLDRVLDLEDADGGRVCRRQRVSDQIIGSGGREPRGRERTREWSRSPPTRDREDRRGRTISRRPGRSPPSRQRPRIEVRSDAVREQRRHDVDRCSLRRGLRSGLANDRPRELSPAAASFASWRRRRSRARL